MIFKQENFSAKTYFHTCILFMFSFQLIIYPRWLQDLSYLFKNLSMRSISFLLLIITLIVFTHTQDSNIILDSASSFDSTAPTPIATIDASQTTTNLRSQGQQAAKAQADSTKSDTVQPAPAPQQPQQPINPKASQPATVTQTSQQTPSPQLANANNDGSLQSPKILISEVNQPIVSKGFKIDQGVSYQRIKVGELQKKYLFFNFNLAEKDKWQEVNITISNEGSSLILNKCKYTGIDNCFVPAFTLKPNTVLFVHIQCQDDCTYNMNAQWSDTEHLNPGEEVVFMFGKDTSQIYHVQLDDEDDFEEVRIHLAPRVTRKPFDNIKIYGKFGKDAAPTTQEYDFKSINLWEDGQGIFLKKSALKQKKFVLLIVGQTETTYRLALELVKQATHEISNGQHVYEYLEAKSQKSYHIKSIPNVFDEYSLRFSVLSGGNLQIGYFTDKQLKNQLQFEPFEYMKDSEYILDTNMLDPTKEGLFVRVKTKERDATYTIKFVGRSKTDSIELNQNVYGFIQVLNESKFAHFDFKRWAEETEERSNLKFTVYIIEAAGKVTPQFFVCQSTLGLCTNPIYYKNVTQPITSKPRDEVSQKQVYELQIDDKVLKKINSAEQQATIIVKLNPAGSSKTLLSKPEFNLAAIEFLNNNKVLYLREGRPLEQKMGEKDMKIYKYINSDPNVEEIRIHINEIAGNIIFHGVIQSEDPSTSIQVFPEANTLRFTRNLTQPIYAAVNAQSKSIFGISMQIIHKSEKNKNVSIATISEDVTYTVKIAPNTFAIYEIVPIFYDFSFSYSSSQSIIVCSIDPKTNSCINPDGNSAPNLAVKGVLAKAHLVDRKARIKITNPFSDSIAEVSFIFHSRIFDHCDDKRVGQVYQEVVKDGSCVSYSIEEGKTVELYISKREFASLNYRVLVCGNMLANTSVVKALQITPEITNKLCLDSKESRRLSVIWSVTTKNIANKEEKSVKVDLLAQYTGQVIVLTEGVSYNKIGIVGEGYLARFAFNIINKKDTRIILNQIRGTFKMFAKLAKQSYKQTDLISNINYHFASSQTVDYSQEPIIAIREKDLELEWCVDCAIMIVVYCENDQGFEAEFDIQIVQKYAALNEDTAVDGYLDAGSFAYYSYTARQEQNSTILVLLSDHNQQCANMYLSLMENPSATSHIAKTIGQNELIFRHSAGERKYYLSVEAVKTCDYTLSVLTIDSSIHNLKRGRQNLIKFPQGVVKYFSLDHYTDEPFKILSLTKYGEINIYINQSSVSVNRKSFTTSQLALGKFTFKSQHSNTLTIDKTHPLFCVKCNYFIAIEALKNTEATLYLVYPQTTVTLTQGHFLSDYLAKKGDYTLATYNRLEKTQVNIKVYSGTLDIVAVYKQKTISGSFSASSNNQMLDIDFLSSPAPAEKQIPEADPNLGQAPANPEPAVVERIPINFMILAKSDNASYTLELKSLATGSNIKQLATYQSLIAGEPNRIQITSSKALCLTGYLRQINESLILSANNDNRAFFSQLIMQATIGGQTADITKTFSKNIMGITLTGKDAKPTPTGKQFTLCMKLTALAIKPAVSDNSVTEVENDSQSDETSFTATITQANTVNILPSDTESVVKGDSIFVIHSEGQFLLDVFECKDEAKISFGNSMENIEKSKLKMLDMVNMPDQRHAIKISEKETTFVKIRSTHSIVKWIPIDYEAERGLGYIKYSSGDLRYSSKFKEISVQFQPLQQSKPTKAKVKDIKYILYISNSSQSIDFSSQCSTDSPDVQLIPLVSPSLQKSKETEYQTKVIEKQDLQQLFPNSQNIYFNIVCQLSLQVPPQENNDDKFGSSDQHEHYRFIYSRQQIPLATYQQNQIESIPYHYLILLLVSVAAFLILFTYLFTRKIVPLIARLKNSNLVEEEAAPDHKDDLEVPASSDRNQRAPDIAVETEEKFGK